MKIPALKFIQLLLISFLFSSNWLIASSEKEMPYTVFSKLPFEYSDYFTKPKEEEITDSIKIVASPGEYEPATLAVFASKRLTGVNLVLDAVQARQDHGGEGQVGVAGGVRRAELDALGFRVVGVGGNPYGRRAVLRPQLRRARGH